jgi:hypothetical protein
MVLLTLEQAAARLDTPRDTIEEWIRLGLLSVRPSPLSPPPPGEQCVAEEELFRIADSVGWLHLSQQNWDDAEEI